MKHDPVLLEPIIERIFDAEPSVRLTYSQICYKIGERRRAGELTKISPTFRLCKETCELLVTKGRLEKGRLGRSMYYGRPATIPTT